MRGQPMRGQPIRGQPMTGRTMSGVVMIRYWAGARAAAGCADERLDVSTVGELVSALAPRGPLARVLSASSLLIDGRAAQVDDTDRPLATDAVVDVLPPFAGG